MSTVTNSLNKIFFRQSATPEHTIASQEAGVVYYGSIVDGGLLIDDSGDGTPIAGPFQTLTPYEDGQRVAFVLRGARPLILSIEGGFTATNQWSGLESITESTAEHSAEVEKALGEAKAALDEEMENLDERLETSRADITQAQEEAEAAKNKAQTAHDAAMAAIVGSSTEFAVGASETAPPTSGWNSAQPTRAPGEFIWMRTTVNYANGSSQTASPVLVTGNTGADGDKGDKGDTGVGVTSIVSHYLRAATKPAKPTVSTPSGWTQTEPAYVAGQNLYRSEKVTYSNGSFAWSDVSLVSAYTAASLAMTAADGKATITYGTVRPSSPKAGDRFYNSANGETEIYSGSVWRDTTPGEGFVPALDIGSGTAGDMSVGRLTVVGGAQIPTAVIDTLVGQDAFIRNMYSSRVVVAADNLMPDPYFDLGTAVWNVNPEGNPSPGGVSLSSDVTYQNHPYSVRLLQRAAGNSNMSLYGPNLHDSLSVMPTCTPGEKIVASCMYYLDKALPAGALGSFDCRIYFYREDGTFGNTSAGAVTTLPVGSWFQAGGKPLTVPNGAVRFRVVPTVYLTTGYTPNDAKIYIGQVEAKRQVGSVLIEDGAVNADKITADEAFIEKLATSEFWATLATVENLVVTSKMLGNEIEGKVFKGGLVRGAKVETDALTVGPQVQAETYMTLWESNFNANTTGWAGILGTIARVTTPVYEGAGSLRITYAYPKKMVAAGGLAIPAQVGDVISAWVCSPSAGGYAYIAYYQQQGDGLRRYVGNSKPLPANTWVRLENPVSMPGIIEGLEVVFDETVGSLVYVDLVQARRPQTSIGAARFTISDGGAALLTAGGKSIVVEDLIDAALLGPNEIRIGGSAYQRSGTLASIPQTPTFTQFGSTFVRTIDIVLPYDPPDGWIFRWFTLSSSGYTTIERAGKETQLRVIQVGNNNMTLLASIGWELVKL